MNSRDILNQFTFATSRLNLKPVDSSALAILVCLYGCSNTMRYIAAPFSAIQTQKMLQNMLQKQQRQQCDSLMLRLQDKISVTDYGIAGILNLDFTHKAAEVGVMLLANAQGRGFAVEATQAIVAKLINLGIETLYMDINATNKAAVLLATKLGFIANIEKTRYIYQYVV